MRLTKENLDVISKGSWTTLGRLCLITAAMVWLVLAVTASEPANAQNTETQLQPMRLILLVDESGSMVDGLEDAMQAAALMVLMQLADDSEFAVLGFGHDQPGASAVEFRCAVKPVGPSRDRADHLGCIGTIGDRPEKSLTNHYAALRKAVDVLTDDARAPMPSVIFLLTDGNLNLATDEETEEARQLVAGALADAAAAEIPIWTLGFGTADPSELAAYTAGGAGSNPACVGVEGARPESVVVSEAAQVVDAVLDAIARSQCLRLETIDPEQDDKGRFVIRVPTLATSASISVEVAEGSEFSFVDPMGRTVPADDPRIVRVSLSSLARIGDEKDLAEDAGLGDGSDLIVLRSADAVAGTWLLQGPRGVNAPKVRLLWTGQLDLALAVERPPTAESAGVVTLWVADSTTRPVVLPSNELNIRVSMSIGDEDVNIAMADDGVPPDRVAADGFFSGVIPRPADCGSRMKITALSTSLGLSDTQVEGAVRCGDVADSSLVLHFDPSGELESGTCQQARALANNASSTTGLQLAARLQEPVGGAHLKLPEDFEILRVGAEEFVLSLCSEADPGTVSSGVLVVEAKSLDIAARVPYSFAITEPTCGLVCSARRYWPVALLLPITVLVAKLRARKRLSSLAGLRVEVSSGNEPSWVNVVGTTEQLVLERSGRAVSIRHALDSDRQSVDPNELRIDVKTRARGLLRPRRNLVVENAATGETLARGLGQFDITEALGATEPLQAEIYEIGTR